MRSVILLFLVIFLAFAHYSFAQGEEVIYTCRGHEVRLWPVSTALAIESPTEEAESFNQIAEGSGVETLFKNPDEGRFAFQFRSEQVVDQLVRSKSSAARAFPVYLSEGGTLPVWTYGEVTVRWRPGTLKTEIDSLLSTMGLEVRSQSRFDPLIYLLTTSVDEEIDAFQVAASLSSRPQVEWAEPNLYGGQTLATSDPYRGNQIYLDIVHAEEAWTLTKGNPDVVVAVLDEGIDLNHPDLVENIYTNPDETPGDLVDNDGNGFTDDVQGWDFYESDNTPIPTGESSINAHGTAVAGLIAATQGNGQGISGLAPECTLLPVRVFNGSTYAGNFLASEAIRYAATFADVINCSWSGDNSSNDLMSAIDYAVSNGRDGQGCVVVFASGNGGNPVSFPGSYAWTVAVGETDSNDLRNPGSNYGDNLTLTAPLAAWTTDLSGSGGFDSPDPDYTDLFTGTSSSAPLASALAALLISANPGLTGVEVVLGLINGLDAPMTGIAPNDPYGKSPELGYGRLNAGRSLLQVENIHNDRLEPNDIPGVAPTLKQGYYPWLYMEGGNDYYHLEAVAGQTIHCTIQFLSLLGSLNAWLKDEAGGLVASATETETGDAHTLSIEYTPSTSGVYDLLINTSSGRQLPYTLQIQLASEDDTYEPNQTLNQAKLLVPGSAKTYSNLVLNDDDYYRVDVDEEQYLYALLSFNQNQGDLGFQILDSVGGVIRSSNNVSYGEQVDPFMATTTSPYYIRVFSSTGGFNREYSLHLAITSSAPIEGSGNDDPFEENDTPSGASSISPSFHPNLSLDDTGGETSDFFRFSIPARKCLRVTVGWNGLPDIDLNLYDSQILAATDVDATARSTFRLQDVESVSIPAIPQAKEYWLEVFRYNSTGQSPYRMAVEVLDPVDNSVAFYRFCEGAIGTPFQAGAIRDWRGPLLSHQAVAYAGIGNWVEAPNSSACPGSDGVAVDCSGGGIYFEGNGDHGELDIGDHDFTLWARIKIQGSGERVIAGIPGVWEFLAGSDNTLDFTTAGSPRMNGSGPALQSTEWCAAACVWDKTNGLLHLYTTSGQDWLEASTSITGVSLTGSGLFHIGSTAGGSKGAGLMEQVRYFDSALTSEELRRFSIYDPPAHQSHWPLYR